MSISKLGTLIPGENPEDISSYEGHGGDFGATQYYGPKGWDIETSKRLSDYRKQYGPTVENRIAEIWQKLNSDQSNQGLVAPMYTGETTMAKAQKQFLQEMADKEANDNNGLRSNYQKARNPMLY
jgi:hypothetical protein